MVFVCILPLVFGKYIKCTIHRYNEDVCGKTLEAVGLSSNMKLSQAEWHTVRRRAKDKPRRFSQKFVASQLLEREKYRDTIRKLQNIHCNNKSIDDANSVDMKTKEEEILKGTIFDFDVYAPIPVGALVTAFNKRFRIIQRGKVMAYDADAFLYLVEFESKEFGYELCSDTTVASCGGPTLLLANKHRRTALGDGLLSTKSSYTLSGNGPSPGTVYYIDIIHFFAENQFHS